MALSNKEFLKAVDDNNSIELLDLLIIVLDKLRDDFQFIAPLISAGGPDNMLYGKAYLDDSVDYTHEFFKEGDERADVLEAIQCIPKNCHLGELFVETTRRDDLIVIDYASVTKLKRAGYEVIIDALCIENDGNDVLQVLDGDYCPFPLIRIIVGDLIVSF